MLRAAMQNKVRPQRKHKHSWHHSLDALPSQQGSQPHNLLPALSMGDEFSSILGNLSVVLSVLSAHFNGLLTQLPTLVIVAFLKVHSCHANG